MTEGEQEDLENGSSRQGVADVSSAPTATLVPDLHLSLSQQNGLTPPAEEGEEEEAAASSKLDGQCAACGNLVRRHRDAYCSRCGLKLRPNNTWDARLGNSSNDKPDTPALENARRRCLRRKVRVDIRDGRRFVGRLLCIDRQRNLILNQCVEYRRVGSVPGEPEKEEKRNAGLILIGGKHVERVFVAELTAEGKSLWEKKKKQRQKQVEAITTANDEQQQGGGEEDAYDDFDDGDDLERYEEEEEEEEAEEEKEKQEGEGEEAKKKEEDAQSSNDTS
ncbi:LSM domain containing protein [Balamuthia mandrillaris]